MRPMNDFACYIMPFYVYIYSDMNALRKIKGFYNG